MRRDIELRVDVDVPDQNLDEVLRRGRSLRWRRFTGLGATALIVAGASSMLVVSLDAFGPRREGVQERVSIAGSMPTPEPTPRWTTHRDAENGYTVTYPSDWYRAPTPLTSVIDPEEILALGTSPLAPGGTCGPEAASRELTQEDVLIFLTEYGQKTGNERNFQQDFRPRPNSFNVASIDPVMIECIPTPVRLVTFSDGGRYFGMFIYVGPAATTETREEVRRVLDSLTFEES